MENEKLHRIARERVVSCVRGEIRHYYSKVDFRWSERGNCEVECKNSFLPDDSPLLPSFLPSPPLMLPTHIISQSLFFYLYSSWLLWSFSPPPSRLPLSSSSSSRRIMFAFFSSLLLLCNFHSEKITLLFYFFFFLGCFVFFTFRIWFRKKNTEWRSALKHSIIRISFLTQPSAAPSQLSNSSQCKQQATLSRCENSPSTLCAVAELELFFLLC